METRIKITAPGPLAPFLLITLVLSGCGKPSGDGDRESTAGGAPASRESHIQGLANAERESRTVLGERGDRLRSLWQRKREGAQWDSLVLKLIRNKQSAFELAKDMNDFCPDYFMASAFQKDTCWLRIVSTMARYESEFRPEATYREHTGLISVGLLMMNPDHCKNAGTIALLQKPHRNIECALDRMALLIARDRALSGPENARGAAAYWSVLRPPYRFRNLQLGRKHQIQVFTRSYRAYSETSSLAAGI